MLSKYRAMIAVLFIICMCFILLDLNWIGNICLVIFRIKKNYINYMKQKVNNGNVIPISFFDKKDVMQNDSNILKYLRDHHLTPPSKDSYQLKNEHKSRSAYITTLKKLFENKTNGFFIECGANDGEYISNTLSLEKEQNWTGLLIEPNKFLVPQLFKKNRKAWIADVCLSLNTYPQKVKFLHRLGKEHWFKGMGIIGPEQGNEPFKNIPNRNITNYVDTGLVECFPLFSLLSAINITQVDYFSLDIEGVEYKVIQAIPFDFIDIRVISVEYNLIPEGLPALIKLMESKGYEDRYRESVEVFFVKKL